MTEPSIIARLEEIERRLAAVERVVTELRELEREVGNLKLEIEERRDV